LTEDLARAVGELSWLVARDDAQRSDRLRLWVDPDLHSRQAPSGWIQVRTARETVALLDESAVQKVSFDAPEQASAVANRLLAEEASGRDCRPRDGITFHGEHDPRAIDELIATIGPPGDQVVAR
jgi:hypothetical protein